MELACGSQTYVYLPFLSLSVTVFVPLAATVVITLLTGPLRWKLWMFDLSVTTNLYVPALSVVTFAPPFFNVIVKPGPTVPVSVVAVGAATAVTASATAAAATAARAMKRVIDLLFVCRDWSPPRYAPRRAPSGGLTEAEHAAYEAWRCSWIGAGWASSSGGGSNSTWSRSILVPSTSSTRKRVPSCSTSSPSSGA